MNDKVNRASDNDDQMATGEIVDGSEWLVEAFSHPTSIGFAILDGHLRYQAINRCLAKMNGIPGKSHLAVNVRELFGEISQRIAEPHYRQVLTTGESSYFEVKDVVLPTRGESPVSALNVNFAIKDRLDRVQQIGVLVVETTEQRKLESLLCKIAGQLRHAKSRENFWFSQELRDSVEQYHLALAKSLELLIQHHEKSTELFTQSIQDLDRQISHMSTLVSSVSCLFSTEG